MAQNGTLTCAEDEKLKGTTVYKRSALNETQIIGKLLSPLTWVGKSWAPHKRANVKNLNPSQNKSHKHEGHSHLCGLVSLFVGCELIITFTINRVQNRVHYNIFEIKLIGTNHVLPISMTVQVRHPLFRLPGLSNRTISLWWTLSYWRGLRSLSHMSKTNRETFW